MLSSIFSELGPWNWMVLGFALLALEIIVPSVFLLWVGIAAVLTGALSLQLWGWESWTWQVQVLVFLALSLVSAFAGKKIMGATETETDEPLLNRRGESSTRNSTCPTMRLGVEKSIVFSRMRSCD